VKKGPLTKGRERGGVKEKEKSKPKNAFRGVRIWVKWNEKKWGFGSLKSQKR